MSGLCSIHGGRTVATCRACNADPRKVLPDWDKKCAEAEAAGTHRCTGCGFVFYLTTNDCPKCGRVKRR